MDILLDEKLKCISVMTKLKTDAYLKLVENAYKNRGGILGQREALKQKTAISISGKFKTGKDLSTMRRECFVLRHGHSLFLAFWKFSPPQQEKNFSYTYGCVIMKIILR